MKLNALQRKNYVLLEIPEDITFQNYLGLKSEIDKAMHVFPESWMVLDFTAVSFINSSGIGLVVEALKNLRKRGGGLFIINCTQTVERLFIKTRLHKDILIKPDEGAVEETLEGINQKQNQ
jgi:stage II sporulation protein AA (anti-sigma F factor antagonist)